VARLAGRPPAPAAAATPASCVRRACSAANSPRAKGRHGHFAAPRAGSTKSAENLARSVICARRGGMLRGEAGRPGLHQAVPGSRRWPQATSVCRQKTSPPPARRRADQTDAGISRHSRLSPVWRVSSFTTSGSSGMKTPSAGHDVPWPCFAQHGLEEFLDLRLELGARRNG